MASSIYANHGKTVLTLIGTCALAALVWWVGPQVRLGDTAPLASFMSRYLVAGGLISAWAAVTLYRVMSERSQAAGPDAQAAAEASQVNDAVAKTETLLMSNFGYYGKVESLIQYNLPQAFVTVWHDWVSELMHRGAASYPDKWPALYQSSPTWRFTVSEGIAGDRAWAGIMRPVQEATDSQPIPWCFAAALPDGIRAAEASQLLDTWFTSLERMAQQLCETDYDGKHWQKCAKQFATSRACAFEVPSPRPARFDTGLSGSQGSVSVRVNSSQALHATVNQVPLIDALLTQTFGQYTIWTTSPNGTNGGSDCVIASGLPVGVQGLALFSRDWTSSGCGNLLFSQRPDSQRQLRKPLEQTPTMPSTTAIT